MPASSPSDRANVANKPQRAPISVADLLRTNRRNETSTLCRARAEITTLFLSMVL
jgi:hypothetical protein